jgi:hypothetical protein
MRESEVEPRLPYGRIPDGPPRARGRRRKSYEEKLAVYLAGLARRRGQRAASRAGVPRKKPDPKPPEVLAARRAKRNEWHRKYYARHRDVALARKRAWCANNPDKVKAARQRRQQNETQRLASAMRSRIRAAFRQKSFANDKAGRSWTTILGYTAIDLMAHLQRQFRGKMTWANFGKWHVDHIRPIASFQFQSVDDPAFRECWALTNLRPLWGTPNRRKAAKRLHLL